MGKAVAEKASVKAGQMREQLDLSKELIAAREGNGQALRYSVTLGEIAMHQQQLTSIRQRMKALTDVSQNGAGGFCPGMRKVGGARAESSFNFNADKIEKARAGDFYFYQP